MRAINLLTVTIVFLFLYQPAFAQTPDLMPSLTVEHNVDSGQLFNNGKETKVLWSKEIETKGALWTRLKFSHLVLGYDERTGQGSTLIIESLKDGKVQILNGVSARQWRNTSAYFNGDAVRLQLIGWPNGRMNKVTVESAQAGLIPQAQESICDGIDDRVLSNDPRAGRTAPGGCTGWLFNDRANCMLTAGHCAASTDVMLFNVPISNSNGSYNFPGPDDQYAVDQTSMQFVNGGVGNDWCYFGCFPNSNTGLTAFEAQGSSYQLVMPNAPAAGDIIRITGFGSTSAPVNPTFNGAQKTHTGPHGSLNAAALGYRTDTTGGNSGSPVILENTGEAIGIHTHGGCGNGSGENAGTGANNPGFMTALDNPLGICAVGIEITFPGGRPDLINPNGGTNLLVNVANLGIEPVPGTGVLHVDFGSGFQAFPMTEVSPNIYDTEFPATTCGSVIHYYVSAQDEEGVVTTSPSGAPASFYTALSAESVTTLLDEDFESNSGWTVTGNATDGQWQRGIPAGGGDRGDPATDGDGSGSCYVTDNVAGNSDVDGGSTVLTSPILDASGAVGPNGKISYYRWYSNTFGAAPEADIFVVEISNDGGATWTNLETVGPTGPEVSGGWILKSFTIEDFVVPTNQVRLRFTASDLGEGSVVEAAVDGIKIEIIECGNNDPVVVAPASLTVTQGTPASPPMASSLADSDNDDLSIRRSTTDVASRTEFVVEAVSPMANPTTLEITLEGSVFARTNVNQIVELFDFASGTWEQVDTRAASRFTDSTAVINPTGDLSRFVETGTLSIGARVRFQSDNPRQQFTSNTDQFIWTIQ